MKSQVFSPVTSCLFLVRFRHPNVEGFDIVFCDTISLLNGVLNLLNCRAKRISMCDSLVAVPMEYASKIGSVSLTSDYEVKLFQVRAPHWFHLAEEDVVVFGENEGHNPCQEGLGSLWTNLLKR